MPDINDPDFQKLLAALQQGGPDGMLQFQSLLGPSDADKKDALTQGLLSFGANTLAAKGANPWQAIGQGAAAGLGARQDALQQSRIGKAQGIQSAAGMMSLREGMTKMADNDLLRKQQAAFAAKYGTTPPDNAPPAPGMAPPSVPADSGDGTQPPAPPKVVGGVQLTGATAGGVPNRRAQAADYQAKGDYWMAQGRPTQAQDFYTRAEKAMPKSAGISTMTSPDGKRVQVQRYEDGTYEVLPDVGPDREKAVQVDTGGKIVAADPYDLNPIKGGGTFTKEQGPDSKASNAVAWARLNEEKRHNTVDEGDPANIDTTAQAIADGKLPPITGYGLRSQGAQRTMARVLELNPDYNAQDYGASQKAVKDFSTGKNGNTVRSFNVSLAHLDTLEQAANALHNGNVQVFNQAGNYIAQQTGNPAPTNFNATKKIVADEIVKAIVGTGGGVADREEAAKTIQGANSPAQLAGVIKQYKELMKGQLGGLRQQYEQTTGRKDFDRFLSPQAQGEAHGKGNSVRAAADAILAGGP